MAEEQGAFDFGGVVEAITQKMIRRHPHVFGSSRDLSADQVKALWGEIKAAEKVGRPELLQGALSGVPVAMPALTRALKLQEKAAKVGFDWNDAKAVLAKIREEIDEVEAEIDAGRLDLAEGEVGDLLFVVVNLARHLKADPEAALRGANAKFERRFGFIEAALAGQGRKPAQTTLAEMDALWNEAKRGEKG
jgi:ATP diphosphatase